MESKREQEILGLILQNSPISISRIKELLAAEISIPTLNRELAKLKNKGYISSVGKGPSLKYIIDVERLITVPIHLDSFFKSEPDERIIRQHFNVSIFETLKTIEIFNAEELHLLNALDTNFKRKIKQNSPAQFRKEFERLMIELSWKSSQIEGNTYNLLDTEQLLKYNLAADSHTKEETQMLLNHKKAIEYTFNNKDLYEEMSVGKIVDIHTLLTQEMGISKNIRTRNVRITGTNYLPPENEFVIQEALVNLCDLINSKSSVFEKAFLIILLISYIQPFEDGNKRTARLSGNAILMHADSCPLSYRNIQPVEYKKAILSFYELNNIAAFKTIFINQYKFAVENYF